LSGASRDQHDLLSQLVCLGVQQLIQEALEQEASDYLEREHNEQCQKTMVFHDSRIGHLPEALDAAEGGLQVKIRQVGQSPE